MNWFQINVIYTYLGIMATVTETYCLPKVARLQKELSTYSTKNFFDYYFCLFWFDPTYVGLIDSVLTAAHNDF